MECEEKKDLDCSVLLLWGGCFGAFPVLIFSLPPPSSATAVRVVLTIDTSTITTASYNARFRSTYHIRTLHYLQYRASELPSR